jgi:hypothetical protein
MKTENQLSKSIRIKLIIFIVLLALSGITAFPVETELRWLLEMDDYLPPLAQAWLQKVYNAVHTTNATYPYLSYGTDWLAFAHLVIATAFIGPLKDPVKNIWVVQFGMIACIMVFPLAFTAGPIRGIPVFWQLIDCSFGVFGFLLLYWCYRDIKQLEEQREEKLPIYFPYL